MSLYKPLYRFAKGEIESRFNQGATAQEIFNRSIPYFKHNQAMVQTMLRRRPVQPLYLQRRRRLAEEKVSRSTYLKMIGRRVGGKATKNSRQIGVNNSYGLNKHHINVVDWAAAVGNATLLNAQLTDVPLTTTNEINKRTRNIIFCKGFKLRFSAQNLNVDKRMSMRVAMVAPKADQGDVITNTQWFMNDGQSPVNRYLGFDDANLNGMARHKLPINREKWVVLFEKKFYLNEDDSGVENSWISFDKYVKVNRNLVYEGSGATTCTTPVYLVYWYDPLDHKVGDTAVTDITAAWRCDMEFQESI